MEECERDAEKPRPHLEIDEEQEPNENIDGFWATQVVVTGHFSFNAALQKLLHPHGGCWLAVVTFL